MNDAKVRRLAGAFGVAGFVVFLRRSRSRSGRTRTTYRGHGSDQRVRHQSQHIHPRTRYARRSAHHDRLPVFLAGFRHTIRLARPDHEWVSTLVFGAGLVVITLELVGDALQAAAALDTVVKAEPAVVRGLVEASFPFFGAVGLLMSALFLSSAGYATLATGALPKWTGWVAYGAAVANLAAAPSILVGPDYRAFYTAPGT